MSDRIEPVERVRAVRRHWLLVVYAVVLGAVAGYLTAPGVSKKTTTYKAEAILVTPASETNDAASVNFDQIGLIVDNGDVPRVAAAQLGIADPADATDGVTAVGDGRQQSVIITVKAKSPEAAARTADAFSDALLAYLASQATTQRQDALATAQNAVDAAEVDANNAVTEADRSAAQANIDSARADLQRLQQEPPSAAPLVALDKAKAEVDTTGALQAPDSKWNRALLLAMFSLFLGLGAALVADRLDARIHTKPGAEEAFGIPLLGEIPPMPGRRTSDHELLALSRPESAFVEAYRLLRTVILLEADAVLEQIHMGAHGPASDKRVILIASPSGGEGKTTTVANLAVLMAETGRKVLVVSADFRRPRVHELFGRPAGPGLTDVVSRRSDAPKLSELALGTNVPGVYLLASGRATSNPAAVLPAVERIIRSSPRMFDVVLVDTAPLLVANDAAELIPAADAVIVLGRDGRTTYDAARRSVELLRRIDAPVIGSVLIGTEDTPTAHLSYRSRYYGSGYGEKGRSSKRRPAAAHAAS